MDILGTLGSALGGGGGASSLLTTLIAQLQERGGLPALVGMFEKAGLGEIVQSWLGKGANLPVSAEQIMQVLGGANGAGLLGAVASKAGMGEREAASELAGSLPKVVDALSPDGVIPDGPLGDLAKSALGKLFG